MSAFYDVLRIMIKYDIVYLVNRKETVVQDWETVRTLWKVAGATNDTVLALNVSELPKRFKVVRATLRYLSAINRYIIEWWCDEAEQPTGWGHSEFGIETVMVPAKLLIHLQDPETPLQPA